MNSIRSTEELTGEGSMSSQPAVMPTFYFIPPVVVTSLGKPQHSDYLEHTGLVDFVLRVGWDNKSHSKSDMIEFICNFDRKQSETRVQGRRIDLTLDAIKKMFKLQASGEPCEQKAIGYHPRSFTGIRKNSNGSYSLQHCNDSVIRERLQFQMAAIHFKGSRADVSSWQVKQVEEESGSKINWGEYFGKRLIELLCRAQEHFMRGKSTTGILNFGSHLQVMLSKQSPPTLSLLGPQGFHLNPSVSVEDIDAEKHGVKEICSRAEHVTMHSQIVNNDVILEYNVGKEIFLSSVYEGESCTIDEGPPELFTAGAGEDCTLLVRRCDNTTVANEKLLEPFLTGAAGEPHGFLLDTTSDNVIVAQSSRIHTDQEAGRQKRVEGDHTMPTNTFLKPRTGDAEDAELKKTCTGKDVKRTETSTSRAIAVLPSCIAASKTTGPCCTSCVSLMEALKQTNENMTTTLELQEERNEQTSAELRMQIEANKKVAVKLELLTEQNQKMLTTLETVIRDVDTLKHKYKSVTEGIEHKFQSDHCRTRKAHTAILDEENLIDRNEKGRLQAVASQEITTPLLSPKRTSDKPLSDDADTEVNMINNHCPKDIVTDLETAQNNNFQSIGNMWHNRGRKRIMDSSLPNPSSPSLIPKFISEEDTREEGNVPNDGNKGGGLKNTSSKRLRLNQATIGSEHPRRIVRAIVKEGPDGSVTRVRRPTKLWSKDETDHLVQGVQRFGQGKWRNILEANRTHFVDRSEVDLKDKWRNLQKKAGVKD